jgi:hypothetical protein
LADILAQTMVEPTRGMLKYGKPVMVTEFGASAGASPEDFRAIDHAIGAWCGLVSGHAGSPMIWWWEWVDQGERWGPYRAISAFISGEDLRDPDASSMRLPCTSSVGDLWCRAWMRQGRALGYVLHQGWGAKGGAPPRIGDGVVHLAEAAQPGTLELSWWNASDGSIIEKRLIEHPGGVLDLTAPAFDGHIAFKLTRRP